ncbi:MAG: hypothetical protein U5K76_00635 [Woeseiaceae bacterium]|nr:hypothetical protein [Woeseiaceae bacterium]
MKSLIWLIDDSHQPNLRAGTVSRIGEPDYATAAGPFVRVTAPRLVKTLRDRAANAHYLGKATITSGDYDVLAFLMTVGPAITMYFDKKSHLLRRSERLLPGIGLVRYDFAGYETVDGVAVSRKLRFYLNGNFNMERQHVAIRVNEPLDEWLVVDENLAAIPELTPDPLTRQEVANGVWLIGGSGTYAMFVDMGDYVFAVGGTAGIPERIASLRKVIGDKPIRFGMVTHHHFDHVLSVAPYAAEAATVMGATVHEPIVRRAAGDGEALRFEGVDGRRTPEAGDRVIEIIDIGPTAHTEHLLVAYLPAEGILFEADHFALPGVGPVPPAVSSTRSLAEVLARSGLSVW